MIHYVERGIDTRHALKIDAAVKKPGSVQTAAKDRPIEPVLAVG